MYSSQSIKSAATRAEHRRVYGNFASPRDIEVVLPSGEVWVRSLWRTPDGRFGWGRWERVS